MQLKLIIIVTKLQLPCLPNKSSLFLHATLWQKSFLSPRGFSNQTGNRSDGEVLYPDNITHLLFYSCHIAKYTLKSSAVWLLVTKYI